MSHKIIRKAVTNRDGKNREGRIIQTKFNLKTDLIQEYLNEVNKIGKIFGLKYDSENSKGDKYEPYKEHPSITTKNVKILVEKLKYKYEDSIRLCDLGIGLGFRIFLISYYFKKVGLNVSVDGVEINPDYVQLFNERLKYIWDKAGIEINIYEKSLLKHSLKKYDIVYLFKPFKDENEMRDLYEKLADKIDERTILFDPSMNEEKLGKLIRLKAASFTLWEKHWAHICSTLCQCHLNKYGD